MNIQFTLEPIDFGDLGAIDPVGNITITGLLGSISKQYVYLDSWLRAIEKGAEAIQLGDRAEIDLVEEPQPLIFERKNSRIHISFKDESIAVESVEELNRAVASALQLLNDSQVFPNSPTAE